MKNKEWLFIITGFLVVIVLMRYFKNRPESSAGAIGNTNSTKVYVCTCDGINTVCSGSVNCRKCCRNAKEQNR